MAVLQLLLVAPPRALQIAAGNRVDGVMVDLEQRGKRARQLGFDTQINHQNIASVRAVASIATAPIVVRINALSARSSRDIDQLIEQNVHAIMLPMARSLADVERFLRLVAGRARTIVQVETPELFASAAGLRELPWDWLYVGLNDLMVARRDGFLWQPFADGSLERFCAALAPRQAGFGGVTVIGRGEPIPTLELIAEMVRLSCNLTVLRRSFMRDIDRGDVAHEISKIRRSFADLAADPGRLSALCLSLQARLQLLRTRQTA